MANDLIIPVEVIENKIYNIRGHKVMLDSDLAELYRVKTMVLNQALKRNIERFPETFMFQITDDEWKVLISQFVISNKGRGGRRTPPYVFTEHGVLMLSNVLNSKKAIAVSIQIINVFIKLREIVSTNKELSQRLNELEAKFILHDNENNENFQEIFQVMKQLTKIDKKSEKSICSHIIDWDLIHPEIANSSKELFNNGHYKQAVLEACIYLENAVKEKYRSKTGKELLGKGLMTTAFSLNNPILKLSNLSTQTDKDIQEGYMYLFAGLMSAIRNPKSHEIYEITESNAIHLLFLLSHLMFTLNNCQD